MSIKDFDDIKVPKDIDKAIEKGMKKFEEEESKNVKSKKKKYIGMAAAIVGVITVGVSNPAIASKIPFIGSAFEKLEDLNDGKDYKKYATAVNQKVESNGVGITISEAVSDGMYVYLTYVIESDAGFGGEILEEAKGLSDGKQLMIGWDAKVDFSNKKVDTINSLIGKFIDKNTFIGMERYLLEDAKTEIPNEFVLTKRIKNIEIEGEFEKDMKKIKGEWNFEVPITVNKDITKTIEVNKESNSYKVDKIHISPFEMVIEKSYLGMTDKMLSEHEKEAITVYDEDDTQLQSSREMATKLYLEAPKEDSESIRIVVRKPNPAKAIEEVVEENTNGTKVSTSTTYETQGFEKEPVIDIVIPIK
ncbi:MAG: DUF4179 domain-containing protein [Sarcina sp.]